MALIRYVAPALCPDGYGEFARYILWALHHRGHEITLSTFLHNAAEPPGRFGPKGLLASSLIERTLSGTPEINIVNSTPSSFEQFRIPGTLNIGFTMYESEQIPELAIRQCNRMDAIFVPSAWNRRAFLESGIRVPVHVVHPAINGSLIPPRPRRDTSREYVFSSVFEWRTPHKDPFALLRAYYQEFRTEPVLLRIKTFERHHPGAIEEQIRDLKKRLPAGPRPRVEIVLGSLTTEEMWDFYAASDCYVSTHHGEGWGMPIWESMAMGLPAIATGYGANMEFMTPKNSYPVEYVYDPAARWANIHPDALRAKMRDVYVHQDEARATGDRARSEILEQCTPEVTESMILSPFMRAA